MSKFDILRQEIADLEKQINVLENEISGVNNIRKNIVSSISNRTGLIYNSVNGNYYYETNAKSWYQAEREASGYLSSLVTINESEGYADELRFLHNNFEGVYWTGLTDKVTEGVFEWISGSDDQLFQQLWFPGEPNNHHGNEDYAVAHLSRVRSAYWNDTEYYGGKHGGGKFSIYEIADSTKIREAKQYFGENNVFINQSNGHAYVRSRQSLYWHDARTEAKKFGGDLVVINDLKEYFWLLRSEFYGTYWLGLTDEASEGSWRWVDGSYLASNDFESWAPNEPNNNGEEDYATINLDPDWRYVLNDVSGVELIPGIVEVRVGILDDQLNRLQYELNERVTTLSGIESVYNAQVNYIHGDSGDNFLEGTRRHDYILGYSGWTL